MIPNQRQYRWLKKLSATFTLGLFLLSGCSRQISLNETNQQLQGATLAAFQLYVSGVVVAADRSAEIDPNANCFAEAGLEPTIIKRSKGPQIVDALVGGSAEMGTLAITPQVLQALQGKTLAVFATIQTTDQDIKVVGHRSAGIDSGASLKGKRVGYVGGTFGEIFLSRYLDKHGLSESDVSLTSAGPPQLRDLFLSKSLDAIIIWEPIIQDILKDPAANPDEIFLDVDTSLYIARMNLVASPETLQEKPEEAKKMVQAMLCGEKLIQENPEKAREVLEQWLDRSPGTLENVFDENTFRVELNVPALISDLEAEAQWAKEAVFKGQTTIPNDFSPYVDASIMESVAPERVKQ